MIIKIILNFLLYTIVFFVSIYLHKGSIYIQDDYALYYAAFIISWGLSGLLTRKFKKPKEYWFLEKLYTNTLSFFLMLGILAFIIYRFNLTGVSRFVILNSLIVSFIVEITHIIYQNKGKINLSRISLIYSSKAFSFEFILFGIIDFYLIYALKRNVFFEMAEFTLLSEFYICWFVGSFIGHQFHPRHRTRAYWTFIWQYLKSYVIITALMLFIAFINRLSLTEIKMTSYAAILYSLLSFTGISIYYHIKTHRILSVDIEAFPVKRMTGDLLLNEKVSDYNNSRSSLKPNKSDELISKFKNFSLIKNPEVYEFLNKGIDLSSFDYNNSFILRSRNLSNINYLPDGKLQLLVNLENINRIQNINAYLAEVNNKLARGGIFSSNFQSTYLRHQSYLKKYPYYFANVFYSFDFIWNTLTSKFMFFRKVRLSFSAGSHKNLSLAEGLGRLYFGGFEVIHLRIIKGSMFFIARKIKNSLSNVEPSANPIFKMARLGKNGKSIIVYKFRTMYPYSEFLQEFIYEKFNLEEGGKFRNDFRITFFGAVLRKLWLDELPMIYNWLKGDLKLIGPRPLSSHYFSLYSEELKEKRLKYKPGLIPPYYADNPKTLNEIMASEIEYIKSYESKPLVTDFKYFIKCIYNILFKGARSG